MTIPQYLDRIIYVSQLFVLCLVPFKIVWRLLDRLDLACPPQRPSASIKIIHAHVTNITLVITNADIK